MRISDWSSDVCSSDLRLGLTGWSYGGFMSMFAPTQTQRLRAVVAGAGISNWQRYYGQNLIDQWMPPFFGARVYYYPAVYAKSSEIHLQTRNTLCRKEVSPYVLNTMVSRKFKKKQ